MLVTTKEIAQRNAEALNDESALEVLHGEIAENDETNWTYSVVPVQHGYAIGIYDRYQIFVGMI